MKENFYLSTPAYVRRIYCSSSCFYSRLLHRIRFGDPYAFIRPFLIAVHHALLVFILDGEFDTIKDAVAGIATAPMCCFRLMQRYLKDYFDAFDVKHEHQKDKNQNDLPICLCQRCVKRRISEHMRWNVYMRVNGYKKAIKNRNDLARLHHDLIPWNKLDELEKYKD